MKLILPLFFLLGTAILAQDTAVHTVLQEKIHSDPAKKKPFRRKHFSKMISFYFDNEDLIAFQHSGIRSLEFT